MGCAAWAVPAIAGVGITSRVRPAPILGPFAAHARIADDALNAAPESHMATIPHWLPWALLSAVFAPR